MHAHMHTHTHRHMQAHTHSHRHGRLSPIPSDPLLDVREEQGYDAWFRPAIDPLLGAGCISIPNKLDLLTKRREMNDGRQGSACCRDSGMSPRYSLKYDFFFFPGGMARIQKTCLWTWHCKVHCVPCSHFRTSPQVGPSLSMSLSERLFKVNPAAGLGLVTSAKQSGKVSLGHWTQAPLQKPCRFFSELS